MDENTTSAASCLEVTALTWDKDTVGLFDFEGLNVQKQTFYIQSSEDDLGQDSSLYVTEDIENDASLIQFSTKGLRLRMTTDLPSDVASPTALRHRQHRSNLVVVQKKGDSFVVEAGLSDANPLQSTSAASAQEAVWLVLKLLRVPGSPRGYRLSEGDLLRLGRSYLRVVELKASGQERLSKGEVLSSQLMDGYLNTKRAGWVKDSIRPTSLPDTHHAEESQCRVCYSEAYSMEDPLVSICKCLGSLKFLHISCLKTWIASRVEVQERGPVLTYEWRRLQCELCMAEYPVKVQYGSFTYDLVSISRPDSHYLILEEVSRRGNCSYTCFYIQLNDAQVRCGRSRNCPVRVNDITVSRSHATLHLSREGVYIEDNASKFGTLALVNRAIMMQDDTEVALQVGRTVLVLKVGEV
jgi:hypothetical protein